ncbi:oxidase ustYa family protein [Aspergillus fijiensis CBS 313.89]|uniref:Tat pathway signal sequence n=1 Tax=Aspergillus fijiensis CBS 313.89 TaxID=1448319 RepID=A0A8G1RY37_9EURO|nr:uncharacterized protein BO72DRAFT_176678 [Aspergillus fijiensis CBS 313.89]RAK81695.1 hypothetical protein BO72DRAFT_176678 [Aspergillus fijiensis CBS 313.89]
MPVSYCKLEDEEGDSADSRLSPSDTLLVEERSQQPPVLRAYLISLLPWAFHSLAFLIYTTFFLLTVPECAKTFPTELVSAEPWIHYENVVFQASGLHSKNIRVNEYEGPPSEEIDSNWNALWDVGIYAVPAEETKRLGIQSAVDPRDPGKHLVTIALFHQLHCMNRLRQVVWGESNPASEAPGVAMKHTDHCIDYIRQALMCHADLTPIPIYWTEFDAFGSPTRYDTDWEVRHTCRNFNRLYDWALEGNKTGWHI